MSRIRRTIPGSRPECCTAGAKRKKVSVGHDFGTEVEIAEGLSPNERVVVNPDERTAEGVQVQPAKALALDKKSGRERFSSTARN